jgi:hypothetical protein
MGKQNGRKKYRGRRRQAEEDAEEGNNEVKLLFSCVVSIIGGFGVKTLRYNFVSPKFDKCAT